MGMVPLRGAHEAAYRGFLADFDAAGEPFIPGWFCPRDWSAERCGQHVAGQERGENLPYSGVPCTTRFLEIGGDLLGVANFRQQLRGDLYRYAGHIGYSVRPSARGRGHATTMLRWAMAYGRELGIEALFVTVDPANQASRRVVRKCGGLLVQEYEHEVKGRTVRLYALPT
jgi:predicted acetyltransferase